MVSPLLANIYLHEVMDQWFEGVVRPRMRGRAFLIRFADDMVLFFENVSSRDVYDLEPDGEPLGQDPDDPPW